MVGKQRDLTVLHTIHGCVHKAKHDGDDAISLVEARQIRLGGAVVVQLAGAPQAFHVHFSFRGIQHVERHVCWKEKHAPFWSGRCRGAPYKRADTDYPRAFWRPWVVRNDQTSHPYAVAL